MKIRGSKVCEDGLWMICWMRLRGQRVVAQQAINHPLLKYEKRYEDNLQEQ